MRTPHVPKSLRRLLDKRQDRRARRIERSHLQDVASQGRGDASTRNWRPGGGV
jgi:hypothetical protein